MQPLEALVMLTDVSCVYRDSLEVFSMHRYIKTFRWIENAHYPFDRSAYEQG